MTLAVSASMRFCPLYSFVRLSERPRLEWRVVDIRFVVSLDGSPAAVLRR